MADDLKSLITRVSKLEADVKSIQATLHKWSLWGPSLANQELQIQALQKDGVGREARIKALESKK
jgi:hypothetical protein